MDFNWAEIGNNSIVALIASGLTWLFTSVLKLRKDMDSAFHKIRALERSVYVPDQDPGDDDPQAPAQ